MNREMIAATGNKQKMVEIRQILASSGIELISMKDAGLDIDIVEDGSTFEENALIKARTVAQASGKMAIADDSGLVVDAMGGEPGIHSARWMGHDTSYDIKNREIIRLVDAFCARQEAEGYASGTAAADGKGTGAAIAGAEGTGAAAADGKGTGAASADSEKLTQPRHPGCAPDGTPGPLRSARFVCAVAVAWPDGRERTAVGVMEGRIHTRQSGTNGFGYDPIFYLPSLGMTSGDIPREEKNRISHRGQAFRKMKAILEEMQPEDCDSEEAQS